MAEEAEVLVRLEGVSKKFCRSLRRSLLYGASDVGSALLSWPRPWKDSSRSLADGTLPPLRKDEFWAVHDVSFEVRRGECLGIIGHNGAGKSTVLKMLNGLIAPDAGRITTRGRVAALIELNAGFNPILTGRENIYNQAALLGMTAHEVSSSFDQIVEFSEIGEFLDTPVQNYSSGMRVRLGFAVAAHLKPDVLILDEVLAVGDIAFRYKSLNAIGHLMRSAAVVLVSHAMPEVYRVCGEVMVLDHGRATYHGRNVAEGIAVYMSLFQEAAPTVTGSLTVLATEVEAVSASGSAALGETVCVDYGGELTLRTRLETSHPVGAARVQFLFWSAEMLPVLEIMGQDLSGHAVTFDATGAVDVSATLPRLELNAGKYTVTVIVASLDYREIMCRRDNAVYVQVQAPTPSGAHVVAVGSWLSETAAATS